MPTLKPSRYYTIGLFILIALILIVLFVLGLGASKYLRSGLSIETYFNDSVQGLQKGSPVKYRGIPIGYIKAIDLLSEIYPQLTVKDESAYHRYIYVRILITDPELKKGEGFFSDLSKQIQQGLRVRVTSESITGQAYIELTYLNPKENPPMKVTWTPTDLYIPSATSTMTRFVDAIGNVFVDLQKTHLDQVARHADTLMTATTKAVEDADIKKVSLSTQQALQQISKTASTYETLATQLQTIFHQAPIAESFTTFNELSKNMNQATLNAEKTLLLLNQTLANMNTLLDEYRLQSQTILSNTNAVTAQLKSLTESADRYPAQLFFGAPPPPLNLEKLK